MEKVIPNPRTLTIRFKHNRNTFLLEVDPLQRLSEVRAELLQAIQDSNPSGQVNGRDIPRNPDDIILGMPIDRNNWNMGFAEVGKDDDELDPDEGSVKGKGKGKSTASAASKKVGLKDCPQGVGMKNGDMVAFMFKGSTNESEEYVVVQEWDVEVPTMEETYPEEDQDEGIGMEEG